MKAARAAFEELVDAVKYGLALAEPEPEGPSKAELRQLFLDHSGYIDDEQVMWSDDFYVAARAVLARWGTSNLAQVRSSLGDRPQPVPEREGPADDDIEALHQAVFASRLHGPPPNTSFEVDLVRAALARWGHAPNA